MIDILNRWTRAILHHSETATTIAEAVIEARSAGADLYGANLYGANLHEADLYGADLREADLYEANLGGADLREADLYGANLRGADLYGANLRGANLGGANLGGANLYGADLYGAKLYGANLRGANLRGAKQFVLRIQGSRDEINAIDDDVRIGCLRNLLAQWLLNYQEVGVAQRYSPVEIAEYGAHLRHIAACLEIRKSITSEATA